MDALSPALQEQRRQLVAADAAGTCSAHRWTSRGLSLPPSLLRRETEEYDRRHGLLQPLPPSLLRRETEEYDRRHGLLQPLPPPPPQPCALRFVAGSSSGVGSSSSCAPRTPLLRPRLEDDGEFEAYDPAAFSDSIGPEDFLPEEALESTTAIVAARSGQEHVQEAKRARLDMELDDLLLEQGLDSERAFRDKQAEWDRIKAEQKAKFIILDSDNE